MSDDDTMMHFGGASLKQAMHTLKLLGNVSAEEMRTLHDGFLTDLLQGVRDYTPSRNAMRISLGLLPLKPTLRVNYDLPFETMVAKGDYETVMPDLYTNDFLKEWLQEHHGEQTGEATVSIRLETIEKSVDLQNNEAEELLSKDYRLASYKEIFAFGATYPLLQLRHGTIFGKSYIGPASYRVRSFHPKLWGQGKRGLSLVAGGSFSGRKTTFLFVKKEK